MKNNLGATFFTKNTLFHSDGLLGQSHEFFFLFLGGGPIHSIFATLNHNQNFHMLEDYSILEIIFSPFQQPITNYCELLEQFSWLWCIAEDLGFPKWCILHMFEEK